MWKRYLLLMKNLLRSFVVFFLVIINTGFDYDSFSEKKENSSGFINIIVESNINRMLFEYDFNERHSRANQEISKSFVNKIFSRVKVPLKEFKCPNKIMYRDFLDLLKAEQFPYLEIYLPPKPDDLSGDYDSFILPDVMITVGGVSRSYNIRCNILHPDQNSAFLAGYARIKLSDLDIDPPTRFSGLIKVKNEIIVKFGFYLTDPKGVNIEI